jgi:hypothetical protein
VCGLNPKLTLDEAQQDNDKYKKIEDRLK